MKIHIKKDRVEKSGFFGGDKSYWNVHAHFELNEEEKGLLAKNRHVLKLIAVEFPFTAPNGRITEGCFPTVDQMLNEKRFEKDGGQYFGCVFSNGELAELEEMINDAAKALKSELYGGESGKSVNEI